MASLGGNVALSATPAPLRVARPWPWHVEDPASGLCSPLPRLHAQCVATFAANGRRIGGFGTGKMELELNASDPHVVTLVHGGSHIVDRVFRFQTPVIDAVLAHFCSHHRERTTSDRRRRRRRRRDDASRDESDAASSACGAQDKPLFVCILARSDCVSVYSPNGETFEVALPFHADRVVALSPAVGGGLLLQRRPLTPAPSAAATAAAFSPSHAKSPPGAALRAPLVSSSNAQATQPRYFTLAHPLEEVKPIALVVPPRPIPSGRHHQQSSGKKALFLSDPALDLVDVCALPTSAREDDGEEGEDVQRALVVCHHRHEQRFVVYEMTRHVQQNSGSSEEDASSRGGFFRADATPGTPLSPAAAFVSPAKARQQQREVEMMEQYFKSHIVPARSVRLVWTSPSLDALAGSSRATSAVTSLHRQRAFLLRVEDDEASDDDLSPHGESSHRLGLVDERFGVLLLKPVRVASSDDDSDLFHEREADLRVVNCRNAAALVLRESNQGGELEIPMDVLVTSRDSGKLFLYRSDRVIAEVTLRDRGSRPGSLKLDGGFSDPTHFSISHVKNGRRECWRYAHPLQLEASPLLSSVLEVLRYAIPARDYVKLYVATLALAGSQSVSNMSPPIDDDAQWVAFRRVLVASVGKTVDSSDDESLEHGAPKKARATLLQASHEHADSIDIVDRVLQSEYASTFQYENAAVLAGAFGNSPMPLPCKSERVVVEKDLRIIESPDLTEDSMGRLVSALHLLYEDFRLSLAQNGAAVTLLSLLHDVSMRLGLFHLASYYRTQHAGIDSPATTFQLSLPSKSRAPPPRIQLFFDDDLAVPDVYLWLRERLQGSTSAGRTWSGGGSFEAVSSQHSSPPFTRLQGVNDWKQAIIGAGQNYPLWRTEAVCQVYERLFSGSSDDDDEMQDKRGFEMTRLTDLMEFLTGDEIGRRLVLEDLPAGIRFVVLEAIRVYREDPPSDASERVCEFIGRRDLSSQLRSSCDDIGSATSGASGSLVESTRLRSKTQKPSIDSDLSSSAAREVADGLSDVVASSQRLFPTDQRLKEVARLLRSNRPLSLRLDKMSDMSDQDYVLQQQVRLLLLCKRSMALSVARGMVTLGTFDLTTVQNQAWQLNVPALPLAGRTPPTNATVLLDVSGYAKELTHWPQFHNGCATGLRLPGQDLSSIITRYWIKYHRPSAAEFQRLASQVARSGTQHSSTATARDIDEAHAAHAGVLLGLGLNGHLKCLSMADVYNYLSISNEFITVAILLGMATTAVRSRRKRSSASSAAALQAAQRRRRARVVGTAPDGATQDDGQLPTASQAADVDVDMEVNIPASAAQEAPAAEAVGKTPLAAGGGLELSLERSVSKMLCLHIPALLPPAFAEFTVPASTQTAALLGLGILYQGSGHRLMTELLLTEITRSPASAQFVSSHQSATSTSQSTSTSTPFEQHEGYSLAAGLALGLVLLGRGGVTAGDPGLADLGLEEKLYKYIVGGAAQPFASVGVDAASGGSYLYRGRKWKPFGSGLHGGSIRPNGSSASGSSAGGSRSSDPSKQAGGDRSSWRGEHVNIGVTASGSALALAFMYIKSGNRSIASQLAVPDTLILLDYVRPDILLLRTLAKNLVLWDSIEPTTSWIERTEVPLQLRDAYKLLQTRGHDGASASSATLPEHADIRSICESYANIVAGACFSVGLRFAGTSDQAARDTLSHFVVYFRDMRSRSALLGGDVVAAATDRVTIERCLAVCAQSLGLVDAGSGNLETLTLLRSINLRQRVDNELTYGNHMALSMAIGLLFLGGGRATVSRSAEAIAALVVSLYPVSAMNTADNKYHLQAFRHLYTLAVDKSRHVETIDTASGEPCTVELRVVSHKEGVNGTSVVVTSILKTPCLLPELDMIDRIAVDNEAFYPVDIRLQDQEDGQEDDEDGLWGGRAPYTSRSVGTTANDNRVKLLVEKSKILLERRAQAPRNLISTATAGNMPAGREVASPGSAGDGDAQNFHVFKQYFTKSKTSFDPPSLTLDREASAWWQQRLEQQLLPLGSLRASPASLLPAHLSVLFEVFSLHHPQRRLDSVFGLWNLKLVHEFHRIDPFRSLERRAASANSDDVEAAKRDFVEWLQGQAEEALRQRWLHDASVSLPSLSSVQRALLYLDERSGDDSVHDTLFTPSTSPSSDGGSDESLLLSALFVFFDAPPSVYNNPVDWKRRMQRAMAIASTRAAFAVDRFLQLHAQDQVTTDEQTFWLRVVSCFLFSV